ncbi:unnamed protein product [Cuscuta campestris]|uniref:Polygalacturonase n=1 Tax=Cuscuta campestris TaxID=132261 RepID=A0A484LY04_9ASTE|nr:unnamed protein product [Cuscuta campestris]
MPNSQLWRDGPICSSTHREGTLEASTDLSDFSSNYWIEFEHVDGVEVTGGGTLNGLGEQVWKFAESGEKIKGGPLLPVSLIFQAVNDSSLHDLNFVNSKGFHIKVSDCSEINVSNLKITAPGYSPNTDGIHISGSTNVNVTELDIGTGDDCVSIGDGVNNLLVTKVTCGPGHGLSVGSLGKRENEDSVKGVVVKNCTLRGTTNGARIKTFRASPKLEAASITFEDLIMQNVTNPIIIDQDYSSKDKIEPSNVKLSDVHFRNIRGTAAIKNPAITLTCSQAYPCDGVELSDIDIAPVEGAEGDLKPSSCLNAKTVLKGKQNPPAC